MNTTLGKRADHKTQELSHMDPMPFCGKVLKKINSVTETISISVHLGSTESEANNLLSIKKQ